MESAAGANGGVISGAVVDEVVLQVARMLDAMGVAHAFLGGLALNAWGIPRATFDIDFVVAVRDDDFATFVGALASQGVEADEPCLRGYRGLAGMEKITASLQAAGHWYRLDIFRANTRSSSPSSSGAWRPRYATPWSTWSAPPTSCCSS